jgi:hypothetical protein
VLAEGQGEEVPLSVAERVPCELREGVDVPESLPCKLAVGRGLTEGVVEAELLCDTEAVPLLLTVALPDAEAEAVPRGGEGVTPAVTVPVPLPLPLPRSWEGLATAVMEPEAVELTLLVAAVGGEGEDAGDALPAPLAEESDVGVEDREKLPVAEAALVREAVGVPEGEVLPVAPPLSMGEGVGVPPVGVAVGGLMVPLTEGEGVEVPARGVVVTAPVPVARAGEGVKRELLDAARDAEAAAVADAVPVPVGDWRGVAVRVPALLGLEMGVEAEEGVAAALALSVTGAVGVGVVEAALGAGVGRVLPVATALDDPVPVPPALADTDAVKRAVDVGVSEALDVELAEGARERDARAEPDTVRAAEAVPEDV